MGKFIPKKPPISIDTLIKEAMATEEKLDENLQLSVYLDDTASGDLVTLVRSAFADAAANVRITISYVGSAHAVPDANDDMAVVVAGSNPQSSILFQANREAGVPCMVIAMTSSQVSKMCADEGFEIDASDVISVGRESSELLTKAETQKILDGMGKWICSTCQEKSLSFARSFAFARRPLSIDCVNLTALENGFVGLLFFKPGTNLPIMTANQMKMLLQIAAAYNQPLNAERVPELATVLATAYCMRGFAYKASKNVPLLSMAIRGSVGYITTLCIGRTAVSYFENGGGVSGLAKTLNNAREMLLATVLHAQASSRADENELDEAKGDKPIDKLAELGKQAATVGAGLSAAAVPLVKSAAAFGAGSFKDGVKGLID